MLTLMKHPLERLVVASLRAVNESVRLEQVAAPHGLRRLFFTMANEATTHPLLYLIVSGICVGLPASLLLLVAWALQLGGLTAHDAILVLIFSIGFSMPLTVLFWLALLDDRQISTGEFKQRFIMHFLHSLPGDLHDKLLAVTHAKEVVDERLKLLKLTLTLTAGGVLVNVVSGADFQEALYGLLAHALLHHDLTASVEAIGVLFRKNQLGTVCLAALPILLVVYAARGGVNRSWLSAAEVRLKIQLNEVPGDPDL